MNTVHYHVSGLQNSQAKTQVKNALGQISGVHMVNVDLGRGSIEVGYTETTTENQIRQCIENTGFEIQ